MASQSSSQLEIDEKDSEIGLNESSINKTKEIKEKDVIKNTYIRRIKYKQKNTAAQSNYILNLYGLAAWWERVCRPGKSIKLTSVQADQSNQNAKMTFLKTFSRKCRPEKSENEFNQGSVKVNGSTTQKRPREEFTHSNGENSNKIQKKINFTDKILFFNRGGNLSTDIDDCSTTQVKITLDQPVKIVGMDLDYASSEG